MVNMVLASQLKIKPERLYFVKSLYAASPIKLALNGQLLTALK